MFKKLMSLMAVMVLAAACTDTPDTSTTNPDGISSQNQAKPGSAADFAVNVGDRVFFGYDRSELTAEARATLDKQATWLKKYPRKSVTVEGHADERGTR